MSKIGDEFIVCIDTFEGQVLSLFSNIETLNIGVIGKDMDDLD